MSFSGCYLFEKDESNLSMNQLNGTVWQTEVRDSTMFNQVRSGTLFLKFQDRAMWAFNDKGFQAYYNGMSIVHGQIILEHNNRTEGVWGKLSNDEQTLTLELDDRNIVFSKINGSHSVDVLGYWISPYSEYMGLQYPVIDQVEAFMPDGRNISFYRNAPGSLYRYSQTSFSFDDKRGCHTVSSDNDFDFDMKVQNDTLTLIEQTGTGTATLVPWTSRKFNSQTCDLLNWWIWSNANEDKFFYFNVPACHEDSLPARYYVMDLEGNVEEFKFHTMGRTQLVNLKDEGHQAFICSYVDGHLTLEGNTCTKHLYTADVMHTFYNQPTVLEDGTLRRYIPNGTYVDYKDGLKTGSGKWHVDWSIHKIMTE